MELYNFDNDITEVNKFLTDKRFFRLKAKIVSEVASYYKQGAEVNFQHVIQSVAYYKGSFYPAYMETYKEVWEIPFHFKCVINFLTYEFKFARFDAQKFHYFVTCVAVTTEKISDEKRLG